MANLKEYNNILQQLHRGEYKSVYLLHGEEPYYIDKISHYIESHAIEEHERDFNLTILYGRDLQKDAFLETVRRYPMMAQRQVVVVREAQDYGGKWADFEDYFNQPVSSTILVIDIKYKSADAATKWVKAIAKNGIVFNSTKHYDNELPEIIAGFVRQMKYRINPRAVDLLSEYLGNDLEKIEMELNKLAITVPLSREIGVDDIHRLIGVSKEFNPFEYVNALSARDGFKSYRIAQFLGRNEKNNPMVLIIKVLFNHFSKVMMFHSLKSKDIGSAMTIPDIRSNFAAKQLMAAAKNYDMRKSAQIISMLREYDAREKGVESSGADSQEDMLKELTYRILN